MLTSVFWYPRPPSSSSSDTIVNEASIGWILTGLVSGTWSVSILGDLAYILNVVSSLFHVSIQLVKTLEIYNILNTY